MNWVKKLKIKLSLINILYRGHKYQSSQFDQFLGTFTSTQKCSIKSEQFMI